MFLLGFLVLVLLVKEVVLVLKQVVFELLLRLAGGDRLEQG